MIVFNNTAVASNPAAGPGVVRRMLLTDENAEETGMRFDHLTLAADALFRFEPSARSMVWFQVLEGDAKLKISPFSADRLSDRHSVFLPPAFDATLSTERGVSLLSAELPDAGRFDPEFSTKQPPRFTVSDWTREPVLQCKNDGRKRVPLVTAETCQTAAIKVQMVIYPPGTKSAASYRHEGAESFIYLLSGRGTAGTHDQSSSVRKGDLIWFRDGEWHRLAAADSEMRFLILYAPGVFRTAWDDPSKASSWSPTGLDINGLETVRDARERIAKSNDFWGF